MTEKQPHQVWTLDSDEHNHRVVVWGSTNRRIEWIVDGAVTTEKKTWDDHVRLDSEEFGTLVLRFSALGTPQRATLIADAAPGSVKALAGLGGTDLIPETGSRAEKFEQRLRDHPTLYPLLQASGSAAGIIGGLLLTALIAKFAVNINWPDIPWPNINLPSIPWPDINFPAIPWPDIDITLPDWVSTILSYLKYILPVLIAFAIAKAEVKRRHKQDGQRRSSETD